MREYVRGIDAHIAQAGFRGKFLLVQSTGGLYESKQAEDECVRMLESGPAAGVIGAGALCRALGLQQAVAFDMGGTTAKAGVIYRGEALTRSAALVGRYAQALPIQIPMIDISEVGTGGGSIASVDETGALHVGPKSAGAEPGPACYARGGTYPTVTDANLALGRLDPMHFLGGRMRLDAAAAERALAQHVARPLRMDLARAAEGILRIAVTAMSYAVKGVSTDRGLDAAAFPLIAYGGAGPLHAGAIAREIGMSRVIVPRSPGHFCAFGMLHSDLRYDLVRTWFMRLDDVHFDEIAGAFAALAAEGKAALEKGRVKAGRVAVAHAVDMRYVGQEHPVTVALPARVLASGDREAVKKLFDAEHLRRYGTNAPTERAEVVSLRVSVSGLMKKPQIERIARGRAPRPRARRRVYFAEADQALQTPVYVRDGLRAGNRIDGPALVEEDASTTVLLPGDRLRVDDFGNLDIAVAEETRVKRKRGKADAVLTEIVRNGVIAVTEEMKTNLMRTAYNMIIYEALDFTVGLYTAEGETVSIGLGLPSFIRGMAETVKAKLRHFGPEGTGEGIHSGRHPRHQRRVHHRQPPAPLHLHAADFPPRQALGLRVLHGALARRRRVARRRDDRHLFRGAADPDREVPEARRGEPRPGGHHPHERAHPRACNGRPARANHGDQDRRAALP